MNKTITFAAFILGAGIGAVAAWGYAKKKYEQIAQEEIDSVKKVFHEKREKHDEESVKPEGKTDERGNMNTSIDQKYTDYNAGRIQKETDDIPGERPYVISPDEFGEFDDYSKITLIFYADRVLCDDEDVPVDNVEELVGFDSLTHFGEFEDDSVFVRNDVRKTDYEILRSLKQYSEVLAQNNRYKAGV